MNGTTNGHSAATTEPELYSNSEFDPDDDEEEEIDCNSLEGTSVDDDDANEGDHAEVFRKAEEVIERVVAHIGGSREICNKESKSRYDLRVAPAECIISTLRINQHMNIYTG